MYYQIDYVNNIKFIEKIIRLLSKINNFSVCLKLISRWGGQTFFKQIVIELQSVKFYRFLINF